MIQVGDVVTVRHDLGTETGVVLSMIKPTRDESRKFTVQFADGTISCWAAHRVTPYHP